MSQTLSRASKRRMNLIVDHSFDKRRKLFVTSKNAVIMCKLEFGAELNNSHASICGFACLVGCVAQPLRAVKERPSSNSVLLLCIQSRHT